MIRVFLVEDEPPALRKLERMVASESDLSICGTASTCAEAIAGIQRANPHLAILDVQLPDGTGFEVLQALEEPSDLAVIFLTAYEQYAVEAFEAAAIDYLLKPVGPDRFLRAIQRVRDRRAEKSLVPASKYAKRFLVELRKAAHLLPVESVYRIEADRNYARLFSTMGEFALRTTMDALERRLDPAEFVRVSRSAIVRLDAIREVRRKEAGVRAIILAQGDEVPCSKRYWTAALERLAT